MPATLHYLWRRRSVRWPARCDYSWHLSRDRAFQKTASRAQRLHLHKGELSVYFQRRRHSLHRRSQWRNNEHQGKSGAPRQGTGTSHSRVRRQSGMRGGSQPDQCEQRLLPMHETQPSRRTPPHVHQTLVAARIREPRKENSTPTTPHPEPSAFSPHPDSTQSPTPAYPGSCDTRPQ